jgi:uncharacterized protein (TIGR03437 family)
VINNSESSFYQFNVSAAAPAIFTTNSQGTGQGAILNTSYQLVNASNPATPGKTTYLQIYCMGLGAVSNQPADGAAAPSSPLAETSVTPTVTIGGVTENAIFSGLAPCITKPQILRAARRFQPPGCSGGRSLNSKNHMGRR